MSKPMVMESATDARHERQIRVAKTTVLALACVVALTLVVAAVFGAYHFVTDRPAKELFLGSGK